MEDTPQINENEHLDPEYLRDVLVSVIKTLKIIRADVTALVEKDEVHSEFAGLLDKQLQDLTESLPRYEKPADGVSVTNATINGTGELVLSFSDGKEVNCGLVRVKGDDGEDGEDGESAKSPKSIKPDIEAIVSKVLAVLDKTKNQVKSPNFEEMVRAEVKKIELPKPPKPQKIDYDAIQASVLEFVNNTPESINIESIRGLNEAIKYLLHQYRAQFITASTGGGAVDSVNGFTGVVILDKTHIGLSEVDNTSDLDKPVSTATQDALDVIEAVAKTPRSFGITIDGAGNPITTGFKGFVTLPFNGVITRWDLVGDVAGDIVLDIWKDTYANFPPVVGDSITGTEKPTLAGVQKNQDTVLSTWSTAVAQGDIVGFNVDSVAVLTKVTLVIWVTPV